VLNIQIFTKQGLVISVRKEGDIEDKILSKTVNFQGAEKAFLRKPGFRTAHCPPLAGVRHPVN
jgi:hypothetical protein